MMDASSMTPSSTSSLSNNANDDPKFVRDVDDYVDHYRYYDRDVASEKASQGVGCDDEGEAAGEEEPDAETPLERLMDRGHRMRLLRLLALEDERERCEGGGEEEAEDGRTSSSSWSGHYFCEEKKEEDDDDDDDECHGRGGEGKGGVDVVRVLPDTNETILDYDTYLSHQRYYDDLKHVDHNYIDYGLDDHLRVSDAGGGERDRWRRGERRRRLVVEQRKRLGKGGLCWDAAFVLGEHVSNNEHEWRRRNDYDVHDNYGDGGGWETRKILELGAGTGLCGLMICKSTSNCHVELTDLPELQDLMKANVVRNFGAEAVGRDDHDDAIVPSSHDDTTTTTDDVESSVSCRVLRWGVEDDYVGAPYDVILGADVVTSLYDPIALARTFHALSGPNTMIYVSGKSRLDKPHEDFENEMELLFANVRKVERPCSRLRSPNVFVIVASGKR